MKCLIVDDEQAARENISAILSAIDPETTILEAQGVLDAKKIVTFENPDVIFLDINMPDYNGFDLLELINCENIIIIVITAHLDHSIQAIRKHVFDFLLKPFGFSTMRETLSRIKNEQLRRSNSTEAQTNKNLIFKTKTEVYYLLPEEIVYFASDNNYTNIITASGQKILLSKTIKLIEAELAEFDNFIRVHRSYIVNADYISKFNSSDSSIKLNNGISVDVSDRKRKEFMEFMKLRSI